MRLQQITNLTSSQTITMSSREISDLTGKEHKNVIRDIRTMLNDLKDGSELSHVKEEKDTRGYTVAFHLNKELTLTLVAGYNVKLRLAIIKRWQELEAATAFALPKTFGEALRLAAEQQEKIEQQQAQLLLAAPKVAYVDTFVDHGVNKNITAVAKDLGVSGKKLGLWLRFNKFAFRQKGKMMWYQHFMDSGYGVHKSFNTKTEDKNGTSGTQALLTPKGDLFIKAKYQANPSVPEDFEEVEVD